MLHRLIKYYCIFTTCMSPTLNESFVLQHFERSNAIEMSNRIMFNFYPGLPHVSRTNWRSDTHLTVTARLLVFTALLLISCQEELHGCHCNLSACGNVCVISEIRWDSLEDCQDSSFIKICIIPRPPLFLFFSFSLCSVQYMEAEEQHKTVKAWKHCEWRQVDARWM